MATTLKDFAAGHPVDRDRVEAQLAERIGVGQRQVSKIEHWDLDSAKVGILRSYLEAVGGELVLECVMGDQRMQVT